VDRVSVVLSSSWAEGASKALPAGLEAEVGKLGDKGKRSLEVDDVSAAPVGALPKICQRLPRHSYLC
jgi:hypothetical protein